MIRIEPSGYPAQCLEAAQQQSRAGEQRDCQRHLHTHQHELRRPPARHLRASRRSQRSRQAAARADNRRHESARQRCGHGTDQRIHDDAPVEPDLVHARQILGEHAENARRSRREPQPHARACQRQKKNLGQQLRRHGNARCSQAEAHRNLMLPARGSRKQQRRDIGARDQQQQGHRPEHHPQRLPHAPDRLLFQWLDAGTDLRIRLRKLARRDPPARSPGRRAPAPASHRPSAARCPGTRSDRGCGRKGKSGALTDQRSTFR